MKKTDENRENLFGDLRKTQPFRVPENYFETFADRLKVRIAEEEYQRKNKPLLFYLKPAFTIAASLAITMLLLYVPYRKFTSPDPEMIAQQRLVNDAADSLNAIPVSIFSYFSDDQFISAVRAMNDLDSQSLSAENLADFIAADYSEYEIIANN